MTRFLSVLGVRKFPLPAQYSNFITQISRMTIMMVQNFQAFTTALNDASAPNAALQNTINAARKVKRV
ncbi:hypothetical protein EAE91_17045 [Photorhabdus noenieputensis]|nr:hypothetical protein [Photorhabdus noenieputensis]